MTNRSIENPLSGSKNYGGRFTDTLNWIRSDQQCNLTFGHDKSPAPHSIPFANLNPRESLPSSHGRPNYSTSASLALSRNRNNHDRNRSHDNQRQSCSRHERRCRKWSGKHEIRLFCRCVLISRPQVRYSNDLKEVLFKRDHSHSRRIQEIPF